MKMLTWYTLKLNLFKIDQLNVFTFISDQFII